MPDTTNAYESVARERVRLSMGICLLAPLHEYIHYVVEGNDLFYRVGVLFGGISLSLSIPIAWFLAYPCLMLLFELCRRILACQVSADEWKRVVAESLWSLPWGAILGVVTWFVYSIGNFGGWPEDIIFGVIGNAVGAFCYLSIFVPLYRIWRKGRHNQRMQATSLRVAPDANR